MDNNMQELAPDSTNLKSQVSRDSKNDKRSSVKIDENKNVLAASSLKNEATKNLHEKEVPILTSQKGGVMASDDDNKLAAYQQVSTWQEQQRQLDDNGHQVSDQQDKQKNTNIFGKFLWKYFRMLSIFYHRYWIIKLLNEIIRNRVGWITFCVNSSWVKKIRGWWMRLTQIAPYPRKWDPTLTLCKIRRLKWIQTSARFQRTIFKREDMIRARAELEEQRMELLRLKPGELQTGLQQSWLVFCWSNTPFFPKS